MTFSLFLDIRDDEVCANPLVCVASFCHTTSSFPGDALVLFIRSEGDAPVLEATAKSIDEMMGGGIVELVP